MRRFTGGALAALAAVVLLSDWAAAQQTGLFPLAPIRRRRPPCNQQDPVYRLYKEQYFGYHPTLWRRFPDGWGAPSPEAPNAAKSFEEIPLETLDGRKLTPGGKPDQTQNQNQGQGQGAQGRDVPDQGEQDQPAVEQPRIPRPPAENNRSPFEIDEPAPAPNGAQPPGRGEPSPFEGLGPRAGAPRTSQPAAPELSAPAPTTSRVSRRRRPAEIDPADAGSPLLSAVVESERAAADSAMLDAGDARSVAAAPADGVDQAPQLQPPASRRRRSGSLLGSLGWNVRR